MPAPELDGPLPTSHFTPRSSSVSSVPTWEAEDEGLAMWSLKGMLSPSSHTEGQIR